MNKAKQRVPDSNMAWGGGWPFSICLKVHQWHSTNPNKPHIFTKSTLTASQDTFKRKNRPCIVTHTFNPGTLEAETGGFLWIHGPTWSTKQIPRQGHTVRPRFFLKTNKQTNKQHLPNLVCIILCVRVYCLHVCLCTTCILGAQGQFHLLAVWL